MLIELFERSMWRSTQLAILRTLGRVRQQRGLEFLLRVASNRADLALAAEAELAALTDRDDTAAPGLLPFVILALARRRVFPAWARPRPRAPRRDHRPRPDRRAPRGRPARRASRPPDLDQRLGALLAGYAAYGEPVKATLRRAELMYRHPELFDETVDRSTIAVAYVKAIDLMLQDRVGF